MKGANGSGNGRADGRSEKPTLRTIAQLAGLAVPTVSRALNDAPDIGRETKALVRRIASEIGYVPNRAGVRLRTGRTNVISLVLSTEHDMMNHTARLISSIAGGLEGTPFHLIMTPFKAGDDPMKPVRYIVETRSADAVILNQIRPEDPRVAWLMERGFPFATHGRTRWAEQHPYFDYDNAAFARIGMRRLAEKGRRRIVLIAPPGEQNYSQDMIWGAQEAAADFGLVLRVMEQVTSDAPSYEVRAAVSGMLTDDPQIDGLICASTSATMASVAALEGEGRKLGREMDLFAKEAIPFLNLFRPEIMAIHEDVEKAGLFLAKAAMAAVGDPDTPPLQGLEVPED